MPKAYKQHRRSVTSRKKRSRRPSLSLFVGVTLILITLATGLWISHNSRNMGNVYDQRYEVQGSPSIDVDFINQVLDFYHSPASGKGESLYNLGVEYGIDPVYALAFFMHESSFGTTGVARETLSLGNIRATSGYASYEGYRKYTSWEAGFEDWYKLIKVQYIEQWDLSTIDQIIPVYAPSSDHNDVTAYIQSIKSAVDTWRNGQVQI